MSLKSQIEKLLPGESFITKNTRTGIYVAAKRADVEISTEVVDTGIKVTRKGEPLPELSLVEKVAELSPKDRLVLFESFELCCGMNRGECVCPHPLAEFEIPLPDFSQETFTDSLPPVVKTDDRPAKLEGLRAMMGGGGHPGVAHVAPVETWIEDPQTFENGEILYWHHKPKCKPVCYRRESDLNAV